MPKKYHPDEIVRSCRKLEHGLRFGQEGLAACALGPFQSPVMWTADEIAQTEITKEMLVEKRRWMFDLLNDQKAETPCKSCLMTFEKPFKEVDFDKLGHLDYSAMSLCNIRCDYCSYTKLNHFKKAKYESLDLLRLFKTDEVVWDAAVDFGGGEPTLVPNFAECLEFFREYKIRVYLYTNSVRFSQAAYDGLKDGTVSWLCTSLDCGTPSTYNTTKERDRFLDVMKNLHRYAQASKEGQGNLSIKYIFTENNCSEDDIVGFAFAMRSLQPDKVWLTFDFEPLKLLDADSEKLEGFDYMKMVKAYAQLFQLLEDYDIKVGHFEENHLTRIMKAGHSLMDLVHQELGSTAPRAPTEAVLVTKEHDLDSLKGKNIAIVPCCPQSLNVQQQVKHKGGEIRAIIDKDIVLQGKVIDGDTVMPYEALKNMELDKVLIACHPSHKEAIFKQVKNHSLLDDKAIWFIN